MIWWHTITEGYWVWVRRPYCTINWWTNVFCIVSSVQTGGMFLPPHYLGRSAQFRTVHRQKEKSTDVLTERQQRFCKKNGRYVYPDCVHGCVHCVRYGHCILNPHTTFFLNSMRPSCWLRCLIAWVCGRSLAGVSVRIPLGAWMSVLFVSVVWCQVEVSASGWSLVQRSPTECVCVCDHVQR
jgi:hypothetical protein